MNPYFETLGFSDIVNQLMELAQSDRAKEELSRLAPYMQEEVCVRRMEETTAARRILDVCGAPPLVPMKGLEDTLVQSEIGAMLTPCLLYTSFFIVFVFHRVLLC